MGVGVTWYFSWMRWVVALINFFNPGFMADLLFIGYYIIWVLRLTPHAHDRVFRDHWSTVVSVFT